MNPPQVYMCSPFQYSCLENPMDRGAWWATVHGVAKSWTQLSDFTFTILHFKLKFKKWDLILYFVTKGSFV